MKTGELIRGKGKASPLNFSRKRQTGSDQLFGHIGKIEGLNPTLIPLTQEAGGDTRKNNIQAGRNHK